MNFIPAPCKQWQVDLCNFKDSLVYIMEFKISQDYTMRPSLQILKIEKVKLNTKSVADNVWMLGKC